MHKSEIIVNCKYLGINPVQFGRETCEPSHAYGPAVRTHWLLHYVVKGTGSFTRGGKTYKLYAGDIFVIPPYVETYYEASSKTPWEYIWIGFESKDPLPELMSAPVITCPEASVVFEEMRLCKNYDSGKSAYLCSCIWKLMALLYERADVGESYVDKALSCIHSEYGNGITVQSIADRLNLDRSYLSHIFKKKIGVAPGVYLRNYRLNRAAELIAVYGEKPSVAANSVGYDDIFHFSKSFKKQFGIPPREYKKGL